jgi:hypothetical protein
MTQPPSKTPPPIIQRQRRDPIISRSLEDFLVSGAVIELTPEEAEALGAFEETALDEATAWEANEEVAEDAP